MRNFILNEILSPVCRRLGTAAAAGVATLGATADVQNQVAVAVTAVCGLAFDLMLSRRHRALTLVRGIGRAK